MTKTDAQVGWEQVGDRLEALALKLKLHAEEELSDDGRVVKATLERLGAAVQDAVTAVTDACRDPAVRRDAREAVDALGRAISTTIRDS